MKDSFCRKEKDWFIQHSKYDLDFSGKFIEKVSLIKHGSKGRVSWKDEKSDNH
ncbi:hypothetical protein [Methanosarcina sp. KYL-1]|uniref:hypothetical protein n=1 Tax=Methanosarcina sp. KYL-1 TaxID=2602068 RepID=UPI002100C9D2|nr:hypothetical protein [Methanosarcina sp. KYL-1]